MQSQNPRDYCVACKQSFRNKDDEMLFDNYTQCSIHKDCLQTVVKKYPTSEVAQTMGHLLNDEESDDSMGGMG